MYEIYDDHAKRLPFVRITRIELTNIKSVGHGVLEFNCGKEYVPFNTRSDILGLYGQNGSGKSTVVEVLDLFKGIIGGFKIGDSYSRLVDVSATRAFISIELEFQYWNGDIFPISYECQLESKYRSETDIDANNEINFRENSAKKYLYISNEIIKTKVYEDGSIKRLHTIIDTKDNLFSPDAATAYYFDESDSAISSELLYLKRKSYDDSQSFVFNRSVTSIINQKNKDGVASKYYEILAELQKYALDYLLIIGSRTSGYVQARIGIPVHLPILTRPIFLSNGSIIPQKLFTMIKLAFEQINAVIKTIIPDLQLKLLTTPATTSEGRKGVYINVLSLRGEREFPFECESDGIVKIVSILANYIYAFNAPSATLVVDELDSGIFEYLLGELLEIFEQSGKGQLIFTSHNLRPLEVIDKKFIRFTTSNPQNRYYKLKNVSSSNNLRDLYLREVQLGNSDVEMYQRTKSFKITKAVKSAGNIYENAERSATSDTVK